uniref:Probable ATP-dependent transporter ycf16 n=3 Tax=Rhodosorus marinus TaxID=101924 RepID=A0A7S3ELP2_9RHOD|mmetsp:Transcript_42710/g.166869  ORF Transcript_42710/g.166869 Transcript_42710/m.166869 type:complete len:640 (+) Transcript_42710:131-2050(+)
MAPANKSKKFLEKQRKIEEKKRKEAELKRLEEEKEREENGANGELNGSENVVENGNGHAEDGRVGIREREKEAGFRPRSGPVREKNAHIVKDLHCEMINIQVGKLEILRNSTLTLAYGRKYGLIGRNGVGKSTLLRSLYNREIPIPENVNIIFVEQECAGTEKTVLQTVLLGDEEREWLLKEEKDLSNEKSGDAGTELEEVYLRLQEIDSDAAETRASTILTGLGFDQEMMNKPTKEYSGGWRMRVALAQALFCEPDLLLLDEPTNHLDVVALTWLEEFLLEWERTVIIVSHDRGFLNKVTQDTIHLHRQRLTYYGGNYDTFVRVRAEHRKHAAAVHDYQMRQKKHLQEFIGKFRNGHKKMARQAQARMKMLTKLEGRMEDMDYDDPYLRLEFPDPGHLPPPCISVSEVSFGYPSGPILYEQVNFGVDTDSRVAIVGKNGAGKSTMLKLLNGEILPVEGWISRHPKLRLAKFSQHHVDMLDLNKTPLQHMRTLWPDIPEGNFRRHLGQFGLSGNLAITPIKILSGGQKSRVAFAEMAYKQPHIMLFDEPTNHLDIETIESLAWSIMRFEGGAVLVSHDERLISLVAEEIWVCTKGTNSKPGSVEVFNGDFNEYRKQLAMEMAELGLINGTHNMFDDENY